MCRNYGQFCPIARASELLAECWSIIILRNIHIGCRTLNEIADGAHGTVSIAGKPHSVGQHLAGRRITCGWRPTSPTSWLTVAWPAPSH
jgi:hypothetical protein